jgi:hypothetical protein
MNYLIFGCPSQVNGSERFMSGYPPQKNGSERFIVFLVFCPTSPMMIAVEAMQHQIHIIARALPINPNPKEPSL